MEEPLQKWVDFKKTGVTIASPVAVGLDIYNTAQQSIRNRDELYQTWAFGSATYIPDLQAARQHAAQKLMAEREGMIVDAAQVAIDENADPKVVKDILNTPTVEEPASAYKWALEEEAATAQREEALTDNSELREQESVRENQLKSDIKDLLTKQYLLYSKAQELESQLPEFVSMDNLSQMAVDIIPLSDAVINELAADEKISMTEAIKRAFTPDSRKNQRWNLINTKMSNEQFKAFIDALDKRMSDRGFSVERRRRYFQALGGDSYMENFMFLGDGIATARGALRTAVGIWNSYKVGGIQGMLQGVLPGNSKEAISVAKETLSKLDSYVENEPEKAAAAVEAVVDAADKPNKLVSGLAKSVYDDATDKAVKGLDLDKKINIFNNDIVDTEVKEKAIQVAENSLKKKLYGSATNTGHEIIDRRFEKNFDGSTDVVFEIGTGAENRAPFVSEEAARNAVESYKLVEGEYQIVRKADGYTIQVRQAVNDSGFVKRMWEDRKEWNGPALIKEIFAVRFTPKEMHGLGKTSEASSRALSKAIEKEFDVALKGMSKKDVTVLATVIDKGQVLEKWYSKEALEYAGLNEKQIKLYNLYRELNDLDYRELNKFWRKKLHQSGYRDIVIGDNHYLGKTADDIRNPQDSVFNDISAGRKYSVGEMTDQLIKELKEQDKVFIRMRTAIEDTTDGIPYTFIIVDRNALKSYDLPQYVIPYVAGGRRFYARGTVFTKELRDTVVNGKSLLYNPITTGADLSKAKALKRAGEVNRAKKIYRQYKAGEISKEVAGARLAEETAGNEFFRVSGLEDFESYLQTPGGSGVINWKYDTEVLENGQKSKQITALLADKAGIQVEEEVTDAADNTIELLSEYTDSFIKHRSKEVLKDVYNDDAIVVDFLESASRTEEMIRDLKISKGRDHRFANNIKSNFWDILDPDDLAMENDKRFILEARLRKDIDRMNPETARKISAWEYAKKRYESISSTPTRWDQWYNKLMLGFANNMADSKLAETFSFLQRNRWGWNLIQKMDPVKFAKVVASQTFLGLLNPRQLVMQAMDTRRAIELEPVYGTKALAMYPSVLPGILTDDPKKLAYLASKAEKFGVSKETYLGVVDFLQKLGAHAGIETSFTGYTAPKGSKLLNSSMFFARKGEEINYNVAAITSYLKHEKELLAAGYKPFEKTTQEIDTLLERAAAYQDDLMVNMNKINDAPILRYPIADVVLQFMSYPLHALEVYFNKNLTPAQRMAMFVDELLLYGIDGAVGTTAGFNVYDYNTREMNLTPEQAYAVQYGADGYIGQKLGFNFASSSGRPADILFGVYNAFMKGDPQALKDKIPSVSALNAAVNSGSFMMQAAKTTINALRPDQPDEEFFNDLYTLVQIPQPGTLTNIEKALIADRFGILLNNRGDILKFLDPEDKKSRVIGLVLGADSPEVQANSRIYYEKMSTDEKVKTLMKDLRKDFDNAIIKGSEDLMNQYYLKYKTLLNTERDEVAEQLMVQNIAMQQSYLKQGKISSVAVKNLMRVANKGLGLPLVRELVNAPDVKNTIKGE